MTTPLTLDRDSSGSRKSWEKCLTDARDGCRDAQARLFETLRPHLVNSVQHELDTQLGVKVAPSDLVQEVLLEAWQRLPEFRGGTRAELIAWLHKLLGHRSIDAARKYRTAQKRSVDREQSLERAGSSPDVAVLATDLSPSQHMMGEERRALVERAIRNLPASDEQVLRLRIQTELTFAEIGRILGISEDAARKRWARAAERLGRELKNHAPRQFRPHRRHA